MDRVLSSVMVSVVAASVSVDGFFVLIFSFFILFLAVCILFGAEARYDCYLHVINRIPLYKKILHKKIKRVGIFGW